MNTYFRVILLTAVTMLALSVSTETLGAKKEKKRAHAKCHVALSDGTETVVFWFIPKQKIASYAPKIEGKKIAKAKGKVSIYKAFECVADSDEFSSARAQLIDSKTPR
ncbi:TapY2 family type IVa secretion system protein [Litorilituus sediminis]|uniref:Uncharacterized protein n=1 Tax=Litorilituus sediminis TaxID=718192 RepID=A0A4P6P284_9GAMM|nr:TapY2 family type IVa secretion system protein [Litorilituus sediminis]QBG35341.1 hypothetical protein EMK97_06215 [Litorilituus sediminis]